MWFPLFLGEGYGEGLSAETREDHLLSVFS